MSKTQDIHDAWAEVRDRAMTCPVFKRGDRTVRVMGKAPKWSDLMAEPAVSATSEVDVFEFYMETGHPTPVAGLHWRVVERASRVQVEMGKVD